jgi:glucose-6-phosphate 1-epimerase
MQTVHELNEGFGIAGVLRFEEGNGGLTRVVITSSACHGEMYLYGAHVTAWQPAGEQPGIYLSEDSKFAVGTAIRGGIPLIFPWFGARAQSPVHGFARIETWTVAFAAVSGDDVHLSLTLAPGDESRRLGFDEFRLAYEVIFGKDLTVRLHVANQGDGVLEFEDGMHTYLSVGDIANVSVLGLKDAEYLDKTDDFKQKTQTETGLRFTGTVDRPYLNTAAAITVEDPDRKRRLVVHKKSSNTTVVWNPWSTVAATMPDIAEGSWRKFVCVEAVNALNDKVKLRPKEAHTLEARYTIEAVG